MDETQLNSVIKIFVIDDNLAARSVLSRHIKNEKDLEVIGEAGTGQGGIIMLGELSPDVIMLEAAVSGGMQLADIIKELENIAPNAKIILCTDFSHDGQIPKITHDGQYDFVRKPYVKNTVLRAIRNAVRE